MTVAVAESSDAYTRVRLALAAKDSDPLRFWHFGVPRLREAFKLFTASDPIDELLARGPNVTGKSLTIASWMLHCLQKRTTCDGVPVPQWYGKVEGAQLVLDYPQQLLSVQSAYLRLLGHWPHHARYKGEILSSLRIKPVGGSSDESTWSVLHFLSQENRRSGTGVRGDVIAFDEPPHIEILRELRKAAHAGRRSILLIGATPTIRRQWAPLKEDYGDSPRSTLRRVDRERAEVRWSLGEVADWILSPAEKDKLRRKYLSDPLREAREHGDYIDTSGMCPFDLKVLERMLLECTDPIEVLSWRISHEVTEDGHKTKKVTMVPVQIWKHAEYGKDYYIPIDPASGSRGGHPLALHVVERDTGDLVARFLGHESPYIVGVLAAGMARQYNNAMVQPEINDGWATGVFQALSDSRYGHIGTEPRELQPGKWHDEMGFRTTPKTRPGMFSAVKAWVEHWGAGIKYAHCPSREVINNLMDVVLDEEDKPVVIPGAHHGEDAILRGQSLKKCGRRRGMDIPESHPPQRSAEAAFVASLKADMYGDTEPEPGTGMPATRSAPRV